MAGVIEKGRAHNPLTLWTVPVLAHVCRGVDDPQSIQLRKDTTTIQRDLLRNRCTQRPGGHSNEWKSKSTY